MARAKTNAKELGKVTVLSGSSPVEDQTGNSLLEPSDDVVWGSTGLLLDKGRRMHQYNIKHLHFTQLIFADKILQH